MDAAGFARARVPGRPRHRHQRQDLGGPHDRGPAGGGGPVGGRLHEPPSGPGQRADGLERRADRRRRARRAARRRSRAVEDLLPDAPSYFEILTAAALRWFGDIAVDVAVVEVGLGGTGDATNVVEADGRRGHQREHRPRRVHRPDARRHRGREGRASSSRRRRWCWGRPIPTLVPYFLDRGPASVARARRRLRRARQPARDRRPRARSLHAARGRTTTCSSRCTARTRPTTPRSRSRRRRRSSVARSIPSSSPTRSRTVQTPGRLEVVGHQPLVLLDGVKNVAGAHALRAALADEFADSPRTLVVGLMREKEPHEMLEALGARDAARARVLPTRQPARPVARRRRRRRVRPRCRPRGRRRDRRRARRGDVRDRGRRRPTGRSSITGSLYVVSPARALVLGGLKRPAGRPLA